MSFLSSSSSLLGGDCTALHSIALRSVGRNRESEWTLWRAPMQDFEEIITAVDSCQRHVAGSYVRIINYNNKKVFYVVPPL